MVVGLGSGFPEDLYQIKDKSTHSGYWQDLEKGSEVIMSLRSYILHPGLNPFGLCVVFITGHCHCRSIYHSLVVYSVEHVLSIFYR